MKHARFRSGVHSKEKFSSVLVDFLGFCAAMSSSGGLRHRGGGDVDDLELSPEGMNSKIYSRQTVELFTAMSLRRFH